MGMLSSNCNYKFVEDEGTPTGEKASNYDTLEPPSRMINLWMLLSYNCKLVILRMLETKCCYCNSCLSL